MSYQAPEYYANLTSPPPVKVSQYPEDKHGGYSDSVATLLQHNLIAINNLKQSMLATLLHTKTVIIINFWYSNSIWSGWVTREGEGWIVPLASSPDPFRSFQHVILKCWEWAQGEK